MVATYQTVEEVDEGVQVGFCEAISYWAGQMSEAVENLPRLRDLVSRIITQVLEEHPEAKWSFGMHQDGERWQLTVYSNDPSSWHIFDVVRPMITDTTLEDLGLYLINVGLEEAEQEE